MVALMGTGCKLLRIGSNGGLLWTR